MNKNLIYLAIGVTVVYLAVKMFKKDAVTAPIDTTPPVEPDKPSTHVVATYLGKPLLEEKENLQDDKVKDINKQLELA